MRPIEEFNLDFFRMNLAEKVQIEFFNGPHTINGKGTFEFLRRHLNWNR